MNIVSGQTILHYRFVEKIGEGGMGVVWKALDTTLDREVAIKILPEEVAGDPDRAARFEREAKLLASLSHPNIAAIYSVHSSDGLRFLSMELVPGEDLGRRIARGPLPVDEALDVVRQIADALESAHDSGVIHRDLKPANVQLTPDGKVKVLDLGLAKALLPDTNGSSSADPAFSPTLTSAGTQAGLILGTAAYMSPEQARGRAVDKRADIWALGCILYEMLAARRLFEGETISDTLAAVLRADLEFDALPEETPAEIRRLLRRCLDRDPRRRLRDAGELRIAAEYWTTRGDAEPGSGTAAGPVDSLESGEATGGDGGASRTRRIGWPALLAATLGGALIATLVLLQALRPEPRSPVHLSLVAPEDAPFQIGPLEGEVGIALSPDGSSLLYTGTPLGARPRLFVRPLNANRATPIEGTEDAHWPIFSPDESWIAFFSGERLLKVPRSGGNVVTITKPASAGAGMFWGEDGMIYYSPSYTDAVHRIPAGGGEPEALTSLDADAGDFGHWWPTVLPGNRYLLYSRWHTTVDDCSTWRLDLRSGEERKLLDQACAARYAPPGYLMFSRGSAIAAVRIDAGSGEISGDPVVVLDDAYIDPPNGFSPYSISADGTLAYVRDKHFGSRSSLVWVDLQGKMTNLDGEIRDYRGIRISPDGRQLALSVRERTEEDIWIHDLERGSSRRFTVDGTNRDACWTPDGSRIVFSSMRTGPFDLYWKPLDESEQEAPLVVGDHDKTPYQWTSDGRELLFTNDAPGTHDDIWSHSDGGDAILVRSESMEVSPTISPDEQWLAYGSNVSERHEVYVETYPPGGGRWQISTEGGNFPVWSPDGRTLYYWNDDAVFAVEIDTRSGLRAGRPRKLFGDEQLKGRLWRYDLHPDGRRFVVARSEPSRSAPIEIVLDWPDELEARLP